MNGFEGGGRRVFFYNEKIPSTWIESEGCTKVQDRLVGDKKVYPNTSQLMSRVVDRKYLGMHCQTRAPR